MLQHAAPPSDSLTGLLAVTAEALTPVDALLVQAQQPTAAPATDITTAQHALTVPKLVQLVLIQAVVRAVLLTTRTVAILAVITMAPVVYSAAPIASPAMLRDVPVAQ